MSIASKASVPTENGAKYTKQLSKHWAHNLAVEEGEVASSVTFPASGKSGEWSGEAVLSLEPGPQALECRIEASEPGQLAALKPVVERHLDRFAFREAPLAFDWQDEVA